MILTQVSMYQSRDFQLLRSYTVFNSLGVNIKNKRNVVNMGFELLINYVWKILFFILRLDFFMVGGRNVFFISKGGDSIEQQLSFIFVCVNVFFCLNKSW